VRLPDAIEFLQSVLNLFDSDVDRAVFPAGWISLRVTGRTDALLGMQQFDLSGMIEVTLIGNQDAYDTVQELQRLAIAREDCCIGVRATGCSQHRTSPLSFPLALRRGAASSAASGVARSAIVSWIAVGCEPP